MNENIDYEVISVTKKGKKYIVRLSNYTKELIVNEDQIVEYRIIKGYHFNNEELKKIEKSLNLSNYYNKVVNYINYKPRTEKEVIDYLNNEEISKTDIVKIINKLKKIGFIDDYRYATRYTEELIRKEKGKYGVYQSLTQKGIDKNIIEECALTYPIEIERENAIKVASKIVKCYSTYPLKKQKLQIMQKLSSQGYSMEIINYAINHLEFESNFEERLQNEYEKLLSKNLEKDKIISRLISKGYEYYDIKKIINK